MSGPADQAGLAEAVRELGAKVDALQDDLRRGGAAALPPGQEPAAAPSHAWVSSLEAPVRRPPQAPRLLLEGLFLVACAIAAGVADLDAVAIAGVMIGAWVLVALIEWAASRGDARPEPVVLLPATAPADHDDPAWFVPPVEQTLLDVDSETAITRLPPPPSEAEATVEQRRSPAS